jgi:hypothetical protein
LEIDVNYDPQGGYYARGSSDPRLQRPGFKVLHIPGIDNSSSCVLLTDCLHMLRDWSDAHPGHLPIMLMFNAKEEHNADKGGFEALPFTEAAFDALDAEIRSVLSPEKLIVPDDVQGSYPTLRDAVLANNWPTLDKARGRFLFALDEDARKVAIYRGARHALEGRVFFINTDENSPAAAYLTLNDPVKEGERIRRDVARGFLVRTRADADTHEARINDTSRRDAAFASGALCLDRLHLGRSALSRRLYGAPARQGDGALQPGAPACRLRFERAGGRQAIGAMRAGKPPPRAGGGVEGLFRSWLCRGQHTGSPRKPGSNKASPIGCGRLFCPNYGTTLAIDLTTQRFRGEGRSRHRSSIDRNAMRRPVSPDTMDGLTPSGAMSTPRLKN